MNRIVLIGNGFDLAHGLNTRYEDSDVQNISRNFTDMKLMRDRVVNKTYCDVSWHDSWVTRSTGTSKG